MFSEITDRLFKIAGELDARLPDAISTISMVDLMGEWKERIFVQGLDSNGNKIGTYSTKPSYFTVNQFAREKAIKPRGKGKTPNEINTKPFKNGNKRKSMYFPTGYSGLRTLQSRPIGYVNLAYRLSLRDAFRVYKFGDAVLFGNADENEDVKMKGNEERFDTDISKMTLEEKDFLKESIIEQAVLIANDTTN